MTKTSTKIKTGHETNGLSSEGGAQKEAKANPVQSTAPEERSLETDSRLKEGESVYASTPPTARRPEGQPYIAVTEDGKYRALVAVDTSTVIDPKQTEGYKRFMANNNLKVSVMANGSIKVADPISRARRYKSVDEFEAKEKKKMSERVKYWDREAKSVSEGYIAEIEALNFKSLMYKSNPADAIGYIKEDLTRSYRNALGSKQAAEQSMAKISVLSERLRERLKSSMT